MRVLAVAPVSLRLFVKGRGMTKASGFQALLS